MELEEFKEIQRQMWEEGDYRPVGRLIEPAAQILVQEAGVRAGQRVLDVGTGSGSVAVAAALAGAEVVGVDITDAWFDEAHGRANAVGVKLDLRLGDAEALPVDNGSFDVVLSSFAAIFAPRHDLVASEFVRVCRDGGVFGITAWTPDGANNTVFSTLVESLPSGIPSAVGERLRLASLQVPRTAAEPPPRICCAHPSCFSRPSRRQQPASGARRSLVLAYATARQPMQPGLSMHLPQCPRRWP